MSDIILSVKDKGRKEKEQQARQKVEIILEALAGYLARRNLPEHVIEQEIAAERVEVEKKYLRAYLLDSESTRSLPSMDVVAEEEGGEEHPVEDARFTPRRRPPLPPELKVAKAPSLHIASASIFVMDFATSQLIRRAVIREHAVMRDMAEEWGRWLAAKREAGVRLAKAKSAAASAEASQTSFENVLLTAASRLLEAGGRPALEALDQLTKTPAITLFVCSTFADTGKLQL